jgi:hypothetical protein
MKILLHYQLLDFKEFVLQDMGRRGYALASGCEPELIDSAGLYDPEETVMTVLVEDRPEIDFNQVVLVTSSEPAALLVPAPVTDPAVSKPRKGYKQDQNLTEEERVKQEGKRARWREAAQGKRDRKAEEKPDQAGALKIVAQTTGKTPTYNNTPLAQRQATREQVVKERFNQIEEPALSKFTLDFQEKGLNSIKEIKKEKQEVVAPSHATFRTADLLREAEGLLNGGAR